MTEHSEKLNDILILRVESLISSLSKFVLTGTTVLCIGFSILTEAGKTFTIFGFTISKTHAPIVLSFVILCIAYQQQRIVKTIDKLIAESDYKKDLLLVANSHHALMNPYYQTGAEDSFFTSTFGVGLLTFSNMVMLMIVEHVATGVVVDNKVYITMETVPVYLFLIVAGINIMIFFAKTLKRSMEEICSDTVISKTSVIYFLVPCIYVSNKLFFQ